MAKNLHLTLVTCEDNEGGCNYPPDFWDIYTTIISQKSDGKGGYPCKILS